MPFLRARTRLPLGVDLGPETVSIVAVELARAGMIVTEAFARAVTRSSDIESAVADALQSLVLELKTRVRDCVICAPQAEVAARVFRIPEGMRRSEAERAAALEADALASWPAAERVVTLDPIPGSSSEMLLSVARVATIARRVGVAQLAGLVPVAVDIPACAWQRALPEAEALLDLRSDRAQLVILRRPVPSVELMAPRLDGERLAAQIRAALVQARRDGIADVQRLAIAGPADRRISVEMFLRSDGYAVDPIRLGEIENPEWALAFGLASWSVAPRGLRAA